MNLKNIEELQAEIEKKYRRKNRRKKAIMKVNGKQVFGLKKAIEKRAVKNH